MLLSVSFLLLPSLYLPTLLPLLSYWCSPYTVATQRLLGLTEALVSKAAMFSGEGGFKLINVA